jgi:hypothetical protein
LKAGVDYSPLKTDFSNLDQVLETIKKDDKRQEYTDNAYRDVMESGRYTYQGFVNSVLEQCRRAATDSYFNRKPVNSKRSLIQNRYLDWLSWKKEYYKAYIYLKRPTRWTFIIPAIKMIKFLGLKTPALKIRS